MKCKPYNIKIIFEPDNNFVREFSDFVADILKRVDNDKGITKNIKVVKQNNNKKYEKKHFRER